jgi:sigma-B regulation protein RsbU (phosphoserine phosphatase)
LEVGGPVLGLLSIATYEFDTVVLAPGDLVIVCSDGVTEARNRAGDEFGRDRLVEAVKARHGAKPEAVLESVISAVRLFSEGAAQADDVTAMVLRYRGRG